jgi:hypothetical protein
MATTTHFSKTIEDDKFEGDDKVKMDLEFGRSSFYAGANRMYFEVDGKVVIVDTETGVEIYRAMMRLGAYLGHDRL